MHPVIIHRIATTAILPLVAAGGYAGYTNYNTPYQPPLACTTFTTDVRPGSTAGEIAMLQRFLAAEGYMQADATGYFGQTTYLALTRFQADHGLPITGIADVSTRAVIQQMSCNNYPYYYPYQPQPTYPYQYQPQPTYPYPSSYQPSGYHCTDNYDRNCANGQQYQSYPYQNGYYGTDPSYANGSCYYANGQWYGNCSGNDGSANYVYQYSYQDQYQRSGTVSYNAYQNQNNPYWVPDCNYDRACSAWVQNHPY